MAPTKAKKKRKIPRVKCVGFASYNPQVMVVFTAYSPDPTDRIFTYKSVEKDTWRLPENEDGRHYVILTEPEKITELRPHAKQIYRVLVFGTPTQLVHLDLPILDSEVDDKGRIVQTPRMKLDDLRRRIEDEAVVVKLRKPKPKLKKGDLESPVKKKKVTSKSKREPDGSLFSRLKVLNETFTGDKIDFENVVMIPTLLRYCREIKKKKFRKECLAMVDYGLTEKESEEFIEFVEDSQKTLGKAVRLFLWPKNPDNPPSAKKLAAKIGVDLRDMKLITLGVEKLAKEMET